MATDETTGKRYVKTQTVEGATVTVTKYVGVTQGGKWSWSSATYSVTDASGRTLLAVIEWDGKALSVNGRRASSFKAAVAMVQDAAPPAARRRRSRKGSSDSASTATGSSVIEADPDTGLPRIKPEVQAKADAIVATQVARNAEAGK